MPVPMKMRMSRAADNAETRPAARGALRPGQRRRPRGQALVEFAMILPIFITLAAGSIDFGVALFNRMTVINGAREGARFAATVAPETRLDPGYTGSVQAVVDQAVHKGAAGGLNVSTAIQCVSGTNGSAPNPCDFIAVVDSKKGDYVRVTVDYTYTTTFPLFFGATFHLPASVDMLLEN